MSHKIATIFLTILAWVILPFPFLTQTSFGQMNVNTPYSLKNELNVAINPEYPSPNQNVSVNLTMYTEDLDSATITWYKNGKNVLSGKGQTNFSFTTGAAGEETKIDIEVTLLDDTSFSKSFSINPASVDLIWEANSYVPPFYPGKALHPRQGDLKIVAIPIITKSGKKLDSQNLVYNWSNGLSVYQSQSGYGKNTLLLKGSLLGRSENVKVTVTDPASGLSAQGSVNITPVDTQIIFYENDPYYGYKLGSALNGTYSLKTNELQIVAAPFYFTKESSGFLKYDWQLNGNSITGLSGSRTAVFRKPEDQTGLSSISLSVQNNNRVLQEAENSLMINLGK
jgi:hypothetical protein